MQHTSGQRPLVVDLDGTLILTDSLHELALQIAREKPLQVLQIPLWLASGKAVLKDQLAQRTALNAAALPYNTELLDWLKEQKAAGRTLVLCTASDQRVAQAIADELAIFDQVMASDGHTNLAAQNKAQKLIDVFGEKGFDYAGNSSADLPVWQAAHTAIVVNAPDKLLRQAQSIAQIGHVIAPQKPQAKAVLKMLRVHQWMKNLLLFVPLLAAHRFDDWHAWISACVAVISFSLCASAVYIGNDLLDLESDRIHPRKRKRPFASGQMPIWVGVLCVPLLELLSVALALWVGPAFLAWLAVYFVVTCAYSLALKRVVLVDCLFLALLYTLRIIAGGAAVQESLSHWLITFSGFLFLSLAFVKRYAEIQVQIAEGNQKVHGRGYITTDGPLIQTMGVAAGYATAIVLALYLDSDVVLELYRSPQALWLAIPVLIFWVSWMWLHAHRGEMHDDPVIFAVKNKVSLITGLLFVATLIAGTVGFP